MKNFSEFWRNISSKDGLQTACKACRYTPENLARHQASMHKHQGSPGAKAARKYAPDTPGAKARRAARQLARKATASFKYQQKRYRESVRGRFAQLECQAKRRGKELSLGQAQFRVLLSNPCHYCAGPLSPTGIGLDRKDNALGYHVNNVVPCCGDCNATRGIIWSYAEMLVLGKVVARLKAERAGHGLPAPIKLNEYVRRK